MSEITCKAKKWGSSLGIIIPKKVVDREHIHEGEEVVIEFKKRKKAKEFFGILPRTKKSLQKLKDEAREGWE